MRELIPRLRTMVYNLHKPAHQSRVIVIWVRGKEEEEEEEANMLVKPYKRFQSQEEEKVEEEEVDKEEDEEEEDMLHLFRDSESRQLTIV